MDYDTVATFSQVTSLLMFISLFVAVLAYTFWPGNKRRFDEAQRKALELKPEDRSTNLSGRTRA